MTPASNDRRGIVGLPFDRPPDYAPVDEAHTYPESSYALSKVLGEEMARQFHRWSGIPFVGLRFSNVMVREDYEQFRSFWGDPHARKRTCGATSTRATWRRAFDSGWRPTSPALRADGRGLPGRAVADHVSRGDGPGLTLQIV